ncbi:MAG: NADH-quinone oxidoreductase subunit C [Candidatus Zixiibacteriota bacterium]
MTNGDSSYPVTERLRARCGDGVIECHAHRGDETIVVRADCYHQAVQFLHDDPECDFDFLSDLTAVDRWKLRQSPRFEIILHLYSSRRNARIRLKTRAQDDAAPTVDSIVDVYPAANWPEREVWDMFGVRFAGHPNLKRILMYEEFVGHPLRKDYPVNKRQPLVEERHIPDDRAGMMF